MTADPTLAALLRKTMPNVGTYSAPLYWENAAKALEAAGVCLGHVHEYDYRNSRCVVSGMHPPSCGECGACEVIDTCSCGFTRRLEAASVRVGTPDATGLREDGWNERNPEWWREQVQYRLSFGDDTAWQWLVSEFAALAAPRAEAAPLTVERLAEALCHDKHGPDDFGNPQAGCRGFHRRKAKRLLARLSEAPTPEPEPTR